MSRARHRLRLIPRSWLLLIALGAVAVMFLAWSFITAQQGREEAQEQTGVVEQQRDATAAQARDLAAQIKVACTSGALQGPVCEQAEQVAETPVPTPQPGIPGDPGDPGPPGRGVSDMTIDPAGRLIVTYTDGTVENVGPVVGAAGADGEPGEPGRGIADVEIIGGRLVVTFSDGATDDLGPVVGADGNDGTDGRDGRGIASVDQVDGRLVITYTDGTTQDAGPLPAGPQGDQGPMGPAGEWECPAGSRLLPVEYGDGTAGYGCVLEAQPADPTTSPAPTTSNSDGE